MLQIIIFSFDIITFLVFNCVKIIFNILCEFISFALDS